MTGWAEFAVALLLFLAAHVLPARPRIKALVVARIGAAGFGVVYSLLSLGLLAWLIVAAGRAPYVLLWSYAPWQAWVPVLAMGPACLLLAFGIGTPNPFSFGGRADGFDPARPGIAGVTRHPVLLALALWAGAHMLPNGNLAHVILFGLFAGFALFGMVMIDRRKQREWGQARWHELARATSLWPGAALFTGRWRPSGLHLLAVRLVTALVLYLALFHLHRPVIGVAPHPPGF
ncbi:NnrU family protein [Alkalilacustris brevis]|uniref:NnrU family protein n=1 Tax=Alkalilacustris brevis TaxID=2026338 RepID=UPI000E0DF5C6|nr:NnrU family protein [Alkalilacustris brevis]